MHRRAFTLIELLVVIAIIAILASLLLPVLSGAKSRAYTTACISNLHQLQIGWLNYSNDHSEYMPPNDWDHVGGNQAGATTNSWVVGNARDAVPTNIMRGVQYPYNPNPNAYHCPADRSIASSGSGPRARSYSIEGYVGGYEHLEPDGYYVIRLSDLVVPDPSQIFVFADECEDCIDDGKLTMRYAPDNTWVNIPSSRHQNGAVLSFADGHVEHWRWKIGMLVFRGRGVTALPEEIPDLRHLQTALPGP